MMFNDKQIKSIMQELANHPESFKVFVSVMTCGGQTEWTTWVSWRKGHDEIRPDTITTGDSPLNALKSLLFMVKFEQGLKE